MKLLASRLILNEINKMTPGKPFSWRDLTGLDLDEPRIRAELARLARSGKITRGSRGVYYVPAESWVGPVTLSDEQIVSKMLQQKRESDRAAFGNDRTEINRLVPVGGTLFYETGLTTQVPARKEYRSSFAYSSPTLLVRQVQMEKYRELSDVEVRAWLALVGLKSIANEKFENVLWLFYEFLLSTRVTIQRLRSIAAQIGGYDGRRALRNLEIFKSFLSRREKSLLKKDALWDKEE
jgi:hypothetical protein